MKQQIALDSDINLDNIDTLSTRCEYSEHGSFGFMGYPLVDDAHNVYFTDNSGYKSMAIDTCTLNWHVSNEQLDEMLGLDPLSSTSFASLNSPALVTTDSGDKVVLFAYNEWLARLFGDEVILTKGCYVAALRVEDGSLLYRATIFDKYARDTAICIIHGMMVDGQFAYGGTSNSGYGFPLESIYWNAQGPMVWRGKAWKMDINTGQVVAEWYGLPEYNYDTLESETSFPQTCRKRRLVYVSVVCCFKNVTCFCSGASTTISCLEPRICGTTPTTWRSAWPTSRW